MTTTTTTPALADLDPMESLFKLALGALGLRDYYEAQRIGEMYREQVARRAAQPVTDPVRSIITGVREFYLGLLSSHLPPDAFDQARADDMTQVAYQGVADRFLALVKSVAAQGTQAESAPVSTEPAGDAPGRGPRYTCIGKGGDYELIGEARGAGSMKLNGNMAVYRDTASGALYYRATHDFNSRMAPNNSPVGGKDKA